ncbi:hypothetical protein ACTXT7_006227 [Hymenolepis weldensis]
MNPGAQTCTSILRSGKYAKLPKCSKMLAVPNHVIGCECIHSESTTEYYSFSVGTSFPDNELSNRTLPFDSSEKFINENESTSKLKFPPNYVNFTEQEIRIAAYEVVTITNTSPSQSLYLISIQTSSFTLLSKPITVATLELRQATAITLVLLPNKVGHIEAELYVETNSDLARCKVYGFSTPGKYGIRLLKAERIDLSTKYRFSFTFSNLHPFPIEVCQLSLHSPDSALNEESQVLFLSSENSLRSKIDDLPIHASISLAEQERNGLDNSNFFNKLSKTLTGCIYGIISPADTSITSLSEAENLLLRTSAKVSITFRGSKEATFQCKMTVNFILYANASSFYLPVNIYNDKLKGSTCNAEDFSDSLTFGIFETGKQHHMEFYLSARNPVPLLIKWLVIEKPIVKGFLMSPRRDV